MGNKYKILSGLMALTVLTSACSSSSGKNVVVELYEKKEDEDKKPPIEAEEEVTWVQYDESALMYRVDFDKFLKDKLKLSEKVLENSDVINLLETIHEELGDELYTDEKNSDELRNLDGKSATVRASYSKAGKYAHIYVSFYESESSFGENSLEYEIDVNDKGKTGSWSRSREEDFWKFTKYYVLYRDDKESSRAICLRENSGEYLSIALHEDIGIFDAPNISFSTELGRASVRLSKEDYDALYEIMLSYKDSDDLYGFLNDHAGLLSGYVDLIEEENAEFYEDLCGLINKYTEKAKTLHYE